MQRTEEERDVTLGFASCRSVRITPHRCSDVQRTEERSRYHSDMPGGQEACKCVPCVTQDHAKLLHVQCAESSCSVRASFCYLSCCGPVQAFKCPAHPHAQHKLIYRLEGMSGSVPVTAAFFPAQERRCSCGCWSTVKFTSYCGSCGYPEDLCARRLDMLRTTLYGGHNNYTHCPFCPNLVNMVIVPATGFVKADWRTFLDAHSGVEQLLSSQGAALASDAVLQFMRARSILTWNAFLLHFQEFVQDYTSEAFLRAPGHPALLKLVLHHEAAAIAQQLLFRLPYLFYRVCPRFKEAEDYDENWAPPTDDYGAVHQVDLMRVLQAVNQRALSLTGRPAACIEEWGVLVEDMLKALSRPHRRLYILRPEFDTEHPFMDARLYEQHVHVPLVTDSYAEVMCGSVTREAIIFMTEQMRNYLRQQTAQDCAPALGDELPLGSPENHRAALGATHSGPGTPPN